MEYKKIVVIGASSGLGADFCKEWLRRGHTVCGTYRTHSKAVVDLISQGAMLTYCDIASADSILASYKELTRRVPIWDDFYVFPGDLDPIGPFEQLDINAWENSFKVNCLSQIRVMHAWLPNRNRQSPNGPTVMYFAGGGTNSASINYSAYTLSKIALVKMCELLDAEILDTKFIIVGPGWVKTKIHLASLRAGARAGAIYDKTAALFAGDGETNILDIFECCNWLAEQKKSAVSGRNFSAVNDKWGSVELISALEKNQNMYKLRRSGNDWICG